MQSYKRTESMFRLALIDGPKISCKHSRVTVSSYPGTWPLAHTTCARAEPLVSLTIAEHRNWRGRSGHDMGTGRLSAVDQGRPRRLTAGETANIRASS